MTKKTTISFQKNVDKELYKKAKKNVKKHFKISDDHRMKKGFVLLQMLEYFADDSNFEGEKMRVRITKLNSVFEGNHPNGIEEGFVVEKEVDKLPYLCIGKTISLTDEKSHFHTSTVTEVINETTFKTLNSTYKMEIVAKDTK